MSFVVRFLGTGTSVGVPMIGCQCPVCTSTDPRNVRRRSCFYVKTAETAFVIDTPPDFRQQMLDFNIVSLDAVVFTHAHADHAFGFDDVRRFNTLHGAEALPAYASEYTIEALHRMFPYIGSTPPANGLYRPMIRFVPVAETFAIGDVALTPVPVAHCPGMLGYVLACDGVRVGYVPDCSEMDDLARAAFRGVDVMILDTLRYRPHPAHLNVEASLSLLADLAPRVAYLTHLCHDVDHATLENELPSHVHVSYDGLCLRLAD